MIKRLRPRYSDEELNSIYPQQYDTDMWEDHRIRIKESIRFIKENINNISTGADLSCGDGKILDAIDLKNKYYGDFTGPYEFIGKLEDTVKILNNVDLYICSETLEHLDDPIECLKLVREKTKYLFISTPVNKFDDDNPQHYWAWDFDGIKYILECAGFEIINSEVLELEEKYYYDFQLVYCK